MRFDWSSRSKLTTRDLPRFPEETLFHRIARTVCSADCLPRKELFEAWEVARRARRRLRGGRVVDLACGHALAAHMLLLLDDHSKTAVAVDTRMPSSAEKIAAALVREWPRLAGRVTLVEKPMAEVELEEGDLAVSIHACGALTDEVITKAIAGRARVAVLPCCHENAFGDLGGVGGWMDAALAIDVTRAGRLRAAGYTVHSHSIPAAITPKNRLLLGDPARTSLEGRPSAGPSATADQGRP